MDFEEFWLSYPRKVGRLKAEKIWHRLSKADKMLAIQGLLIWNRSGDWLDIQFVPYPATFLNQRRYEEQPTFPPAFTVRKPIPDYSAVVEAEIADILKRHPDLA